MLVAPVILPGMEGVLVGATARVLAVDVPHTPVAVTETLPGVVPTVVEIDDVDEAPLHPAGNVQLYVVPATGTTL